MNEFNGIRLAKVNFEPTTAATYTSTATLPAGALVKSITTVEGTALAGGTNITFRVGTQALTAAIALSAFTGTDAHALTTVDGLIVTDDGFLNALSTGTFTGGDIETYVEYYA